MIFQVDFQAIRKFSDITRKKKSVRLMPIITVAEAQVLPAMVSKYFAHRTLVLATTFDIALSRNRNNLVASHVMKREGTFTWALR
jgi:hypothetical protein